MAIDHVNQNVMNKETATPTALERPNNISTPPQKSLLQKGLCAFSDDEDEVLPEGGGQEDTVETGIEMVNRELQSFQKESAALPSLIAWWKAKEPRYPYLSAVARRLMAVRATSAEAERDFSAAGFVAGKQRLNLSWDSMNVCTFCSLNSQYVPTDAPDGFKT